ncbi:MORN motif protein (macronuclear) [Tetrahymena thermophila SB210]|uniref:MORN motif protein n=1 Tax=Tetrahymena thermophila (strain SB210) TaxID=312017 RepID=Q22UP2_TETTS|nr:MORN motif protein [Tetrahymena thermophila SB210]EAR88928.2 MORN motif protein [Tetrahymena thermophila SB210]|eukprot:XP_001009173.2 MORN motif protein [Tetrahymena thermophila SB210]
MDQESFEKRESSPIAQRIDQSHNQSAIENSQLVKNLTQGETQEEINISLVINQGYVFIVNNDQTPFAQIAFVDDCYPKYNGKMGIENFMQQKNIQSVAWTSSSDFIEKIYPTHEERELALTYLKQNMRDSRQLQTIYAILNETVDKDWHESVVENPLSMNLRGIEMIQEMLLEELIFLSLRLFLQQGFDQSFDGLSVFLKLQPLQLILAFVDCFPSYSDLVYSLVMKQGIIQRSIPKSKNDSNKISNLSQISQMKSSQLNSGQQTPLPMTHYEAENISNNNQLDLNNVQNYYNNTQNFNPDQNFAAYIQSFIRFAQVKREGDNKYDFTTLIDAQGRIDLLKEIISELDCSLPNVLKQLGVKERQSNDFLKKQFIQQIKNIRTCINNSAMKNAVEVNEDEGAIVDRIQTESDLDEYSYEKSHQDYLFYADREDEINYQQQQTLYQVAPKINFEQHRLEAWNQLYDKIKQGVPLSKYEEDQWRYFAFEDNFQNALITLGEKVLIQDQDIKSALKCYQILFCLGHRQSSTILYSLLCLTQEFSQAQALIMNTNLNVQKSYILMKLNQHKEAIDLINRNFKTSTQIGSKIQFCYILSNMLQKQSKYLAALTAFQILNKSSSSSQDLSLIFKLFLIGKLVQKGLYFQQQESAAIKIYNYILNNLKPAYMYEFITFFFIKQSKDEIKQSKNNFAQQVIVGASKNSNVKGSISNQMKGSSLLRQESSHLSSKSQNSTMKIQSDYQSTFQNKPSAEKAEKTQPIPWDQLISNTLNIQIQDIRIFLEKEHQRFYNIIHNINTDHETRRDYLIAHTLGNSILFKSEKEYNRSYFDENKSGILRQNQRFCKILSDFSNPTMMWPLTLVKPYEDNQSFNQKNRNEESQTKQQQQSTEDGDVKKEKNNNLPLIKQNFLNNGNYQFEGRLVQNLPPRLNQDEIIMHSDERDVKRQLGHFTINNQIFSKWVVKSKYLFEDNGDTNFLNLAFNVSPYFLNIYAISHQDSSILTEPYLCTFEELCQNKLSDYNIDEQLSGKLIKEISGLFQIVSLCVSLHNSELYGYISFFGKNILLVDNEGFIKTPNFLVLVDGSFQLDWNTIPHELLLEEGPQQQLSKCDIWGIGSLLLYLFYGKSIVNETNSQKQVDKYLQDVNKFKTQEYLDDLFAQFNIKSEKNTKNQQDQKEHQNEESNQPGRYFEVSSMSYEFRWLLESIIRKCLRYEAVSRPSALELLLEIHEFIKKSNPEGIFTLYNIDSVSTKIKSLKRIQYCTKQEGQKQEDKYFKQSSLNQDSVQQAKNKSEEQEGRKEQSQQLNTIKEDNNESFSKEQEKNTLNQNQNDKVFIQENGQPQKQLIDMSQRKSHPDLIFSETPTPQNSQNSEFNSKLNGGEQSDSQYFKNKENRPISAIKKIGSFPKNYILDSIKENDFEASNEFNSSSQFYFIPGGSVLLKQGNKSYYFTPYKTEYHINSKPKKQDETSLKEILTGEGKMLMQDDRVFQGYFGNFGLPHSGFLLNQFTKKTSVLGFEESTRMPRSDATKTFIDDTKDKQELFKEQQQLNKVIQQINGLFNSTKKFLDFFGNWISCDFLGSNCTPSINNKTSPLLFITENKTLYIHGQQAKAFLFDYSIMTYSIFEEIPTQGIVSASSLQQEEKILSMLDLIKSLSNSWHVVQHLLEGCKYNGGLSNWDPIDGKLSFYDTEIQVNGSAQKSLIYQTVLTFPTGDCYKGGLLNGKYWDYGRLYSNNRLVLEGKFVDNSMIYGTLYYTDDKIKYVGEVFFDESDDSYKKHGKGTLYMRNGDIYEGDFSLDLYHGFGKILYDGGKKGYFEGVFNEGLKHGVGVYCDKIKGIEFNGEYEYNKRSKYGIEKVENKHEYQGNFKEGKKHGHGVIYYKKGKIKYYDGTFEDDKKHGGGIEIDENDNKYLVKYWKDGLISSNLMKKNIKTQQTPQSKQQEDENTFYKFI